MTRIEFKAIVEQAIEHLTCAAEDATGRKLPRHYCFSWSPGSEIIAPDDVAEFLTSRGFVDEDHISPCWDLFLEQLLPDGKLLLTGYRAGYAPCAYGAHFQYNVSGHDAGRVGPFKLGCGPLVEKLGRRIQSPET